MMPTKSPRSSSPRVPLGSTATTTRFISGSCREKYAFLSVSLLQRAPATCRRRMIGTAGCRWLAAVSGKHARGPGNERPTSPGTSRWFRFHQIVANVTQVFGHGAHGRGVGRRGMFEPARCFELTSRNLFPPTVAPTRVRNGWRESLASKDTRLTKGASDV
jgi:hypothetical protein